MEHMEPELDGNTEDAGNQDSVPGETRLEKVMRERFGAPAFGSLMDGIVDKMFKDLEDKREPESDGGDGSETETGSGPLR